MKSCLFCNAEFRDTVVRKRHLTRKTPCTELSILHERYEELLKKYNTQVQKNQKLIQEPIEPIQEIKVEPIQEVKVKLIQETDDHLIVKTFEEYNITIYGTFDKPLFKAKDIGDLLGIVNIRESIKDFTDKQKDVVSLTDTIGRKQDTIMLTERGLYKVILRSRKPIAIQFQDWICEVISEIRKTCEFKIKIKNSNELFIQQYDGKPVNYLGNVQEKDGYIIKKYGKTNCNLYDRLKEHKKQYGTNFYFTNIIECNDIHELEKKIQTHELLKDRHVKSYDGKLTQELIKLDDKFTNKNLMKIIDEIKDTLNNTLEFKLEQEKTKQIEQQEKTKQIEQQEKTKQIELDLDNKKIEFEMMKLKLIKPCK